MMFLFFLFYNEYFYSPTTLLHKGNTCLKIYIIFIVLACLPYLNSYVFNFSYYCIIIILHILIYPVNLFKALVNTYILLICSIIYLCLFYYNINCCDRLNNNFEIFFPYHLSILDIHKNRQSIIKKLCIKYLSCSLPNYVRRLWYISILNFIALKVLFITTKRELVFSKFIDFLKNLNYFKYVMTISFSFQFIQIVINNFNDLHLSVKIKYNIFYFNYNFKGFQSIVKFLVTYLTNLFEHINYTTSILWTRKLYFTKFYV
uniref:Uncharacterized protein n=1 Tax=Bostrychia tenella TaxID=324755 RepID=A0A1Z1M5X4_9FLOR|nr:hypothetical protein [Bostrychia tenella]ARW61231.1 hypothetical protein [Bostrychia tenella]